MGDKCPRRESAIITFLSDSANRLGVAPKLTRIHVGMRRVENATSWQNDFAKLARELIHRHRARAEGTLDPGAPLVDGPAVIFGVVELDPGEGEPAASLRIHSTQRNTPPRSAPTSSGRRRAAS